MTTFIQGRDFFNTCFQQKSLDQIESNWSVELSYNDHNLAWADGNGVQYYSLVGLSRACIAMLEESQNSIGEPEKRKWTVVQTVLSKIGLVIEQYRTNRRGTLENALADANRQSIKKVILPLLQCAKSQVDSRLAD